MNKAFSIFLLAMLPFMILPFLLTAQDSPENWTRSIRSEVAAINAPGAKYRMEEDDSNSVSSEGSETKKYFEGNHLRKVTLDAAGAMGNSWTELYFFRDSLIFCYEVTKLYAGPISDKRRPLISEEHNRYYLHRGRLFRFINTKGRKIEGEALREKEKNLQQLKQALLL